VSKPKKKLEGGYISVQLLELLNIISLKQCEKLSFLALRTYLACRLLLESRKFSKGRVCFGLPELSSRLGGVTDKRLKGALQELSRVGVLTFTEAEISFSSVLCDEARPLAQVIGTKPERPIPIPRRILRLLVREQKSAVVIATLVHLIRCLFKHGERVRGRGLVSAEWVARVFGISTRSVYLARKWMKEQGILKTVEVHQFVLNRFGGCYQVIIPKVGTKFAGLKKRLLKKSFLINQKPKNRTKAGFLDRKRGREAPREILPEELKRISTVLELYQHATRAGWVPESEANRLNVVASAIRAIRVCDEPLRQVRIFIGLIKKQLWNFITGEQEEAARVALRKYDSRQVLAVEISALTTSISSELSGKI